MNIYNLHVNFHIICITCLFIFNLFLIFTYLFLEEWIISLYSNCFLHFFNRRRYFSNLKIYPVSRYWLERFVSSINYYVVMYYLKDVEKDLVRICAFVNFSFLLDLFIPLFNISFIWYIYSIYFIFYAFAYSFVWIYFHYFLTATDFKVLQRIINILCISKFYVIEFIYLNSDLLYS